MGWLLFILIFGSMTPRLFLISRVNLCPDEALWWWMGKHLSAGYYEHGPLTPWVVGFFTSIGGDTEFFVRIGFVVIFALSTTVIYFTGKEVSGSKKAGLLSALLFNAIPLFSIEAAMIAVPESLQVFFYLLTLFCFLKSLHTEKTMWWYLTGLSLGLGFLSMESMILVVPIFMLFLLISHEKRKWLFKREPYLALGIGLTVCVPNLIWNIANGGGSLATTVQRIGQNAYISTDHLRNFFLSQAIVITPAWFSLIAVAMVWGLYLSIKNRSDELLLLSISSLSIIGMLAILELGNFCAVDADWSGIGILPGIILTAELSRRIMARSKALKLFGIILMLAGCAVSLVFSTQLAQTGITDLYGWRELGSEVQKIKDNAGKGFHLLADTWDLASALAFYAKDGSVYLLNSSGERSTFDLQGPIPAGENALFISGHHYEGIPPSLKKMFKNVQRQPSVIIYKSKKPLKMFDVFKCYGRA